MLIPFAPPPGLNSDDTTFKATGRWADGSNVRFVNGSPQVIGEHIKVFSSSLTGTPRNIFPFTRSAAISVAYGTSSKLYVGSGIAAPSDRSPVGLGGSILSWSFAAWGSTLLASPTAGTLYEQSGSGTATEVTQAPDVITCILVTPERQVLALGCNEESSGTFNGLCIRGSDIEDYTDWTTTATNNAFEHILEGSGVIVGAELIGSYVAVWTDTSLYLGQFIGDPGQTYRFDRVAGDCGLIGGRAKTVLNGTAYWLAKDGRLRAWAPGTLPQIIPCPIQRDVDATLATDAAVVHRMVVCAIPKFGEIWIIYPNSSAAGGVAVNIADGTWFKVGLTLLALTSNDLLRSADSSADFVTNVWGSDGTHIYAYECGKEVSQAGPTTWFIQSADQYLEDSQRRMMIRGVIHDFDLAGGGVNASDVTMTLYVRDRPQSTAVTKGPYTITAGATKKDFRASGKLVAVKFGQTTQVDRELRIGKLLFDVVPMGER